jgi:hypothetical protein
VTWTDDSSYGDGGHCLECGRPLLWAGMSWHPHTVEQHAGERRRLLLALRLGLWMRAAVLVGHRVTVRFTAGEAWAECVCSWRGLSWPDSAYARGDGREHLLGIGELIVIDERMKAAA